MAKIPTFETLEEEYDKLISTMVIKESWKSTIDRVARQIIGYKDVYQKVSAETGVPWYFIGIIHSRESSLNFATHLHNGDSLKRRTRHVPAGRPKEGNPPFTWQESAIDALKMKKLHLIEDWSPAREAFELERYNGFGYRFSKSKPLSPYLWSGTTHYTRGKYIADGKYSAAAVDQQLGVMALRHRILQLEQPKKTLNETSSKYNTMNKVQQSVIGFFAFIATSIGGLFSTENVSTAVSWLTTVNNIIAPYWFFMMLAGGVSMWVLAQYIKNKTAKDFAEDRYTPSGEAHSASVTEELENVSNIE